MADLKWQLLAEDADILPPSNDRIFKLLLTHNEGKQVLIDLISTVIEKKVLDVQVRNIELPVTDIEEKEERFDVNCTIENGDQVDVEMHCERKIDAGKKFSSFINKYTYYMTDLHSSQKSKGVKYKDLKRTYQITFSTYSVFPKRPDFLSWYTLRTKDGHQLSDQVNMIIIELDKLGKAIRKPIEELTSQEKWSLFLKFASNPMHRNKINDIIKDRKEIAMAAALLQEISKDERERAIARSRRMYEHDKESDRLTSEEIGERRAERRSNKKWKSIVAANDEKWQGIVANKDTEIANIKIEITRLRAELEMKT